MFQLQSLDVIMYLAMSQYKSSNHQGISNFNLTSLFHSSEMLMFFPQLLLL